MLVRCGEICARACSRKEITYISKFHFVFVFEKSGAHFAAMSLQAAQELLGDLSVTARRSGGDAEMVEAAARAVSVHLEQEASGHGCESGPALLAMAVKSALASTPAAAPPPAAQQDQQLQEVSDKFADEADKSEMPASARALLECLLEGAKAAVAASTSSSTLAVAASTPGAGTSDTSEPAATAASDSVVAPTVAAVSTASASSSSSRDEAARKEEDAGALVFRVISNDGARAHLIWLTQAKNIFATQLPKMPREYIARLVFDRRHRTLLALKNERVVGGVCYRPFHAQQFAEIAFCAVTSSEQVKGYGTRLMNHLKEAVKLDAIHHFLTYADNYAIGYFRKQGFTKQVSMPPEQWVGYIKDYDGGTLMECTIQTAVNYLDVPGMVVAQREWLLARIRAVGCSQIVYPGLAFPPPSGAPATPATTAKAGGASASAGGSTAVRGSDGDGDVVMAVDGEVAVTAATSAPSPAGGYLADLNAIPGVLAAGWDAGTLSTLQVQRDRSLLQQRLAGLVDLLFKHDDSWPFREPVDLSLVPEYAVAIKEPIDLSVIRRRVDEAAYNSLEHFLADINLMFRNCRAFNRSDTEYVACASKLEVFLRARITQGIFGSAL